MGKFLWFSNNALIFFAFFLLLPRTSLFLKIDKVPKAALQARGLPV